MSIQSYLAIARPGAFEAMLQALQEIANIEIYPADDDMLAIVVADTSALTAAHEKAFIRRIENIPAIQCLAMVFGQQTEAVQA